MPRPGTLGPALVAALLLLTGCTGSGDGAEAPAGGASASDGPETSAPPEPLAEKDEFAGRSAAEILRASRAAMRSARALRVTGSIVSGGESLDLDLRVTRDGACTGSLDLPEGRSEFRRVGAKSWIRPSDAFWRKTAPELADQVIKRVGESWVPAPERLSSFGALCDLEGLVPVTGQDDGSTVGPLRRVDGRPAVRVTSGETEGGSRGTALWVAAEAPHRVLSLRVDGGGSLTVRDAEPRLRIEAPEQVVQLSRPPAG